MCIRDRIMSVSYLLYLFNNSPAETPLLFGVYPAYESGGLRQFVYGTLHLFLVTLPVRLGVIYVGGMAVALGALSFKRSDRLTAFFLKPVSYTHLSENHSRTFLFKSIVLFLLYIIFMFLGMMYFTLHMDRM